MFTDLKGVFTCVVVIGKFVCFIMFRSRSAISTTRNFVQSCACVRVRFICATQKSLKERFAISTTRECRLKCMSLVINVPSSVTKRFYQEVAISDKQSIWRFQFRCAAARKLRSVCKRAQKLRSVCKRAFTHRSQFSSRSAAKLKSPD